MKTSEFIRRCATGEQTHEKSVSSVYFDGKHVYSYGKHYPLLIKVGSKWLVNRRGYSSTTAKHIGYASQFADYRIEIPNHQYNGAADNVAALLEVAEKNVAEKQKELDGLKRRNTKKAENLEIELVAFIYTREFLKALTPESMQHNA